MQVSTRRPRKKDAGGYVPCVQEQEGWRKKAWATCKFKEPKKRGPKAQVSVGRPRKERSGGCMHMCKAGEAAEGGHRVLTSKWKGGHGVYEQRKASDVWERINQATCEFSCQFVC